MADYEPTNHFQALDFMCLVTRMRCAGALTFGQPPLDHPHPNTLSLEVFPLSLPLVPLQTLHRFEAPANPRPRGTCVASLCITRKPAKRAYAYAKRPHPIKFNVFQLKLESVEN